MYGSLSNGAGSNGRSSGMWANKSAVLTENDRLSAIVEMAAQAFIDISEIPEPLEAEQAAQRKNEIVSASHGVLNETKIAELFDATVTSLWLPPAPRGVTNETVLARLEQENEDGLTFEETRDLVLSTLAGIEAALQLDAEPSTVEIVSRIDVSASTPALPSNGSPAVEAAPEDSGGRGSYSNGMSPSF